MSSHPSPELIFPSQLCSRPEVGIYLWQIKSPPCKHFLPRLRLGLLQGDYRGRYAGYRAQQCQGGNWSPIRATKATKGAFQRGICCPATCRTARGSHYPALETVHWHISLPFPAQRCSTCMLKPPVEAWTCFWIPPKLPNREPKALLQVTPAYPQLDGLSWKRKSPSLEVR